MPAPTPDLLGSTMAYRFTEAAYRALDKKDHDIFLQFFGRSGRRPDIPDAENIHQQISAKVQRSHTAEMLESGQPANKLARPSGPENAAVGLVMHCQSTEGVIGPFWDLESRSIQALAEKGLSDRFVL